MHASLNECLDIERSTCHMFLCKSALKDKMMMMRLERERETDNDEKG